MFAQQRRISRHPGALDRIVGALDEIRQEMHALSAAGFTEANHTKNVEIVEDRLQVYRTEQAAVRQARADATVAQRAGALGASANEVFQQYREVFGGKPRAEADPDRLNEIFEQMWPIAREMDEIDATYDDEGNAGNLQLVLDSLVLYSREVDQIIAAKKQP
jgi:hypothetical protein